jgi:hypothetical protein
MLDELPQDAKAKATVPAANDRNRDVTIKNPFSPEITLKDLTKAKRIYSNADLVLSTGTRRWHLLNTQHDSKN